MRSAGSFSFDAIAAMSGSGLDGRRLSGRGSRLAGRFRRRRRSSVRLLGSLSGAAGAAVSAGLASSGFGGGGGRLAVLRRVGERLRWRGPRPGPPGNRPRCFRPEAGWSSLRQRQARRGVAPLSRCRLAQPPVRRRSGSCWQRFQPGTFGARVQGGANASEHGRRQENPRRRAKGRARASSRPSRKSLVAP